MYRVTLRQWHHQRGPFYNPFRARDVFPMVPCTDRVWEFEAASEDEVRKLYEEAKAQQLPNVYGFDLIRIEEANNAIDSGNKTL